MTEPSFKIKKFALLALFERAVKVVRTKEVTDILKNFLVEVDKDELRVVATDLELSVLASTTVFECLREGRTVLPAHKALEIAKEAPDDEILIDVTNKRASIQCEDGLWELPVGNAGDYPPLPVVDEIELTPIERTGFLDSVARVIVAASADGLRPALMVVKLEPSYMIAMDGVRIHRIALSQNLPFGFYLPLGAAQQLIALLKLGVTDDIFLGTGKEHIIFKIDTDVFLSTKVAVDYPDSSPFFRAAEGNTLVVSIDKKEFLSAISRVRLTADGDTNLLQLSFAEKIVTLSAASKDGQCSVWRIQASDNISNLDVGFNWRYLKEAIEAVNQPTVVLHLHPDQTQRQPVLVLDEGYTALLRQLKL